MEPLPAKALGPHLAQPERVEKEQPLQKAKRSPQLPQLEPELAGKSPLHRVHRCIVD